jgi:N utilization substance protein B
MHGFMGARTTAREAALQMLFAVEASGTDPDAAIRDYWREMPGDAEGRSYADGLVRGVMSDVEATDARIRAASTNWRLERMTRVDRNLLRLGAYELLHHPEIPRAVILDEAVEIAKRYGTEDSGAFVNGVLDRIADDAGRVDADRGASTGPVDPTGSVSAGTADAAGQIPAGTPDATGSAPSGTPDATGSAPSGDSALNCGPRSGNP